MRLASANGGRKPLVNERVHGELLHQCGRFGSLVRGLAAPCSCRQVLLDIWRHWTHYRPKTAGPEVGSTVAQALG